ncbi:MAG: GxxExxY protein [Chloroflexi bacterium]|nr:GxxExxY protein [Chloroflexota bacterium]
MTKIIHKELSYVTHGALLRVFNTLGPMLPECFYQDATMLELTGLGIQCEKEKEFEVFYRDVRVGHYFVDIWIENGKLILELKVASQIMPVHKVQALSYLKVTGADLAIVVNFGAGSLETERMPNYLRDKKVSFEWQQRPAADDWLYPELSNQLLEVLHRVHFELGPGFLNRLYRRATMVELQYQGLGYEYIQRVPVLYNGHQLGEHAANLICVENKILLATVAVDLLERNLQERLKARLRHLGYKLGLLANFNSTTLQVAPIRV